MKITKNVPQLEIEKLRIFIYGTPKIGKSSFAAANPKAIIMDADNEGTQFLECFRVSCTEWVQFKKDLKEAVEDERFDTIVLDTVDAFWRLCRLHVLHENKLMHESEDKGFGRMYDFVKNEWIKMINYINSAGKGIWFISHAVTTEKKIKGVPRTVITTSLPGSAARMVMAMCDQIIYIDQDEEEMRTLNMVPQSGLECGGRLNDFGLDHDITFETEKEAYEEIVEILTKSSVPQAKPKNNKKGAKK